MGDQFLLWSYTHGQGRETSIIWSSVFIYISDSFPQCDARISYVSLHGTCLCHISPWSVDIFCKGSFYLLDTSIMINFTSEAVLTKFSSLLLSSLNLEDYLFSAWWMISFFEDSQFFTSFREHCTPERSFYHPQTSVSFRSLRIKFIPQLFQMAFNARWNHAPFARRSTLLSCGCLLHSWKKIVPDNIKLWRFEESFQLLIEQFHLSWRVNAGFNGHCPNCHIIYSWINLHSSFKLGKSLCSHQASRLEASGFSFSFFNLGSIGMLFPFFFVSLCGAWGGDKYHLSPFSSVPLSRSCLSACGDRDQVKHTGKSTRNDAEICSSRWSPLSLFFKNFDGVNGWFSHPQNETYTEKRKTVNERKRKKTKSK